MRGVMELLFECSTPYLMSEHSEHKKRNSIYPSNHGLFRLLYKQLTNKKKSTLFTFQKENALPFIHDAKESE